MVLNQAGELLLLLPATATTYLVPGTSYYSYVLIGTLVFPRAGSSGSSKST